jgi:hypothetical protein
MQDNDNKPAEAIEEAVEAAAEEATANEIDAVNDTAAAARAEEAAKPVRIPGPPALADLLDLGIEEEIKKEDKERLKGNTRRFPLSPSQFGACGRSLAMGLAEFVGMGIFPLELLDPRAKRRFSRGYDIEYSMMKQLRKYIPIDQGFGQQYLEMDETQDGKYVIGGSLDTLFITEEALIVDIKSKADYWSASHTGAFEELFSKIRDMQGVTEFGERSFFIHDIEKFYDIFPKDDFISRYFLQLNSYGACAWARNFRSNLFPGHVGIKAVSLLFENKNNHIMAEVRWVPSVKLYDFAIAKMKDIYQWVAIDKKPADKYPADFTLGSVNCRLCPRKAACCGDTRHPYNGPKKKWPTDTDKVAGGPKIEQIYLSYKNALTGKTEHDTLELELIKVLVESGETKFRFPDGKVYEIKYLKTPSPHYELRPSK